LEASLAACQRLSEVSPESKEAWNSLGQTLLAQRRWQDAEQAFGRAVALDDHWTTGLVNLGRALVAQERQAEAHPYFEKAVSIDPAEPWANYYLALDALAAGQCQAARSYAQVVAGSGNVRLAAQAQKLLDKDLKACE
jgi:cytochrome c-type biogenesis protein CcmH/NrfG